MTQPMEPNLTWCMPMTCPRCDAKRREWEKAKREKRCPNKPRLVVHRQGFDLVLTAREIVLVCVLAAVVMYAGVAYAVSH